MLLNEIRWRFLAGAGWVLALFVVPGSIRIGSKKISRKARSIPAAWRERVYPIFLNSPLDRPQVGRLAWVARYVRRAGFGHAVFKDWASGEAIAREIEAIRHREPAAKIMLVGWSGASLWAWDATEILAARGQRVDQIVYLDSQWLIRRLQTRKHPENVGGITLLYREGNTPPAGLPHATAHSVPTLQHLAVASHPVTVERLMCHLATLALG